MAVVRSVVALALALALASCSQPRETRPSTAPPPPAPPPAPPAPPAPPSFDRAATVAPPEPPPPCEDPARVAFFFSPVTPVVGQPLRILAVTDAVRAGELRAGTASTRTTHGGPPWFWTLELPEAPAGGVVATFDQPGCSGGAPGVAKHTIDVRPARASSVAAPAPAQGVWPTRAAWSHFYENVYSAWIEALFDAPDGALPAWPALSDVLRDPKRNLLFDHLGAGEDSGRGAPFLRPDCADLPYFLRAYFAWKLRLPFGVAECGRGGRGYPPSCHGLFTNEDSDERADGKRESGGVPMFGAFVAGTVANKAHSGSARTPFEDEASDYYPVKLRWESLRPGTVYADPYGHVLVVAKRIAESASGDRGGVLYAVDGQPDGTVARKRFWRGNFLYAHQRELGGPGFKHFRPLARPGGRGGQLSREGDDAIARSPEYGDVSREAGALDVEGFYDAMDEVLSPRPLDPARALLETIDALEEQVRTRVQSVDNGRKWLDKNRLPAPMPNGPEIFETSGAWEDFATPSRDLRLLIAIDVARGFPARVARRPERYAMAAGKAPKDVEAELAAILARELDARTVTYMRTDGSPFTLRLADVLARSAAYEMTYNLNDCVETRWGAPAGSAEASTCRGHAPAEQIARMETYRPWFHERRRPPRR